MTERIKLLQGNEACVQGAIYAGMCFFAGYPITPSTEIAELSSLILPKINGKFIQMEDEIASIAATIGASLTGYKSMTATSGPGFSLKQECIGYASLVESPCVIVNVQRCGPSTGLPTSPSQGDLMQSKWGTHGDHPMIVLSPSTVEETFQLTVKAFNFAEKYRTPVILLLDEVVGHLREKMRIPKAGELEVINRKKPTCSKEEYKAYEYCDDFVSPMASIGEGYRYNVTGLMHDETGFPTNSTSETDKLMNKLFKKVESNLDDILIYENYEIEDADILFVSFGGMVRSCKDAIKGLRQENIKAGLFSVKTMWPFPEEKLKEVSKNVQKIVVVEMNRGQMILEVQRVLGKDKNIIGINKINGEVITPDEIIDTIKEECIECLVK